MSNFENPIEFDQNKKFGDVEITYFDLMEISQGGPEVGSISINGKVVSGRYGGPVLYKNGYLYIPAYVKSFFGSSFKLTKINITTFNLESLGKAKDLIFLDEIEGNRIYFFEDMNKTVRNYQEDVKSN